MQLFPRHVIMDLGMGGEVTVEKIARLARAHDGVSVLFMGEQWITVCVTA